MTILLDGKKFSQKIHENIKAKIEKLKEEHNKVPGLAVILVGDDPASQVYVGRKEKVSKEIGMNSTQIKLPESTKQDELINLVESLNEDKDINGILVQLPLPKHIDSEKVLLTIKPEKDVDGFHPINMGMLFTGLKPYSIPCTPLGIMMLLKEYNIDLKGKNTVVLGRSNIVGKPISTLLLAEHCTVTTCHSRTKDIQEHCKKADIIVSAIGKENFVKAEWVKEGAIVVDVGMNRNSKTGKLCGDVDFENVKPLTSYITPVPGGIGPMTIAMLMNNTLHRFEESIKKGEKCGINR